MCNHTSCAQVHELPQNHWVDNRDDTLFSWLHIYYAHLSTVRFEHSVCRGSLMTTYLCIFCTYIYIINCKKCVEFRNSQTKTQKQRRTTIGKKFAPPYRICLLFMAELDQKHKTSHIYSGGILTRYLCFWNMGQINWKCLLMILIKLILLF